MIIFLKTPVTWCISYLNGSLDWSASSLELKVQMRGEILYVKTKILNQPRSNGLNTFVHSPSSPPPNSPSEIADKHMYSIHLDMCGETLALSVLKSSFACFWYYSATDFLERGDIRLKCSMTGSYLLKWQTTGSIVFGPGLGYANLVVHGQF